MSRENYDIIYMFRIKNSMNLNSLRKIKNLDQNQVAESIANLPQQLVAAWEAGQKTKIPAAFSQAANIVF